MSIATMKRRRKQHAIRNRHLAKIGRPGLPPKVSAEKSARRLAAVIMGERKRNNNKNSKGKK